jgi:hypothetical protein
MHPVAPQNERAAENGGPKFLILNTPERIRTSDPQIRSLVLYPAELRVQTQARQYVTLKNVLTRCGAETEFRCRAVRDLKV